MNFAELLEFDDFRLNWARQSLAPYGEAHDAALSIGDGDELRVLVSAPIGIVDLRLTRSGPRSFSGYASSGRLWGWPDVGAVDLQSECHPLQPQADRAQWWIVTVLTIEQMGIHARSDDEPRVRGLADFAIAATRQSAPRSHYHPTSSAQSKPS